MKWSKTKKSAKQGNSKSSNIKIQFRTKLQKTERTHYGDHVQRSTNQHLRFFLAAGCFDREALACEQTHHKLTVIALHFNHALFDRTARAACGFELLTQLGECGLIQGQTLNQGHRLSTPAPTGA
jgi:hypothetical protein